MSTFSSPVKSASFLSKEEALSFCDKALGHSALAKETMPGFKVLGAPIYVNSLEKSQRDPLLVSAHNEFMDRNFSDLLRLCVKDLSQLFQKEVFLDPEISWPGFHLLTLAQGAEFVGPFHFDNEFEWIRIHFPRYQDIRAHEGSFTVLLSSDDSIESGLLYLPENHPLAVNTNNISQGKVRAMANYHRYQTGQLNFHRQLLHSIFGKNHGDKSGMRVTFQGHLVETGGRLLAYW